MNKSLLKIVLVLSTLFLFMAWGCNTVPLTGRKQINLLPSSTMVELSLSSYNSFLKENKLTTDKNLTEQVKTVGKNVTAAAEKFMKTNGLDDQLQYFNWEINVVENEVPNAWCMPGGKVVVYTGILPYAKTPDGIAVVMGHEIAHAIAKHGNERMSQALVAQMGGIALTVALDEKPEETRNLFLAAYGVGTSVGILLPYSRTHESEADRIGLTLMAMAGYNPNEAINFWTRMSEMSKTKTPEFLSTHPSDENRINVLKEFLPEAMKYYKK